MNVVYGIFVTFAVLIVALTVDHARSVSRGWTPAWTALTCLFGIHFWATEKKLTQTQPERVCIWCNTKQKLYRGTGSDDWM